MKQTVDTFTLNTGYDFVKLETCTDLETAEKILTTKKQFRYSYAQTDGVTATLSGVALRCPYCSCITPAYGRYLKRQLDSPFPDRERVKKTDLEG